MFTHNSAMYGTKIIGELILDIIYFPLWWYSRGLIRILVYLKNFIVNREKSVALLVWIKNIHRPMYGQYDWQGRLISFLVRLVQVIFRSIIMAFWLAFVIFLFAAWVVLPILAIYEIFFQLSGLINGT